jgi:glyoxylase-like metal-dependent hydrolase (beta-lactamase superfamily II)
MEIVPNVHVIPGTVANKYLLVEPDGLTLIDTGLPGDVSRIRQYIAGLGYSMQDVKRILITHADGDHVGGLAALQSETGARVYASRIEADAIAAGRSSRPLVTDNPLLKMLFAITGLFFRARPARVDETVSEGQVLPVQGGLQVVETSGHTPGHVSYFLPAASVLFVGDSIVSGQDGLRGSRGANTWDQAQANDAVRKQAALGAKIVCSGHGPVARDAAFPQA